jgi:hypothetical protein
MRRLPTLLALFPVTALLGLLVAAGVPAFAQACTGLACSQLLPNSCTGTPATTTISGTVYAPNGTDPLPNVIVFIPNAPLPPFTAGVACVTPSTPPGGSPLVGTISGSDGTFTISNVPVGVPFPLVIQAGRWRRMVMEPAIPVAAECTNTPNYNISFPTVQTPGDTDDNIPLIAISTGGVDALECVLRKVGIADSQYSDPGGSGRVQFYSGLASPGAKIDSATPSETNLVGTNTAGTAQLNNYDMVMFPCQGQETDAISPAAYQNLQGYVNAGGRVFATHWSQGWLNSNADNNFGAPVYNSPFQGVASWAQNSGGDGNGIINTTGFSDGQTIAQWLALVNPGTTPGRIALTNTYVDVTSVNAPTNAWISLDSAGGPVVQFSFDTPLGSPATNQCGRVLYNDYHVEPGNGGGNYFPNECQSTGMNAQEKLLEYTLFALTDNDNAATLTPTTQAFATEFVTFASPPEFFTWTNQSIFPVSVSLLNATGDFAATPNNCTNVAPNGTCQITVVFTPAAVGARTGTLTVGSPGSTLTATLTGTGLSPFSLSPAALNFPATVIGGTASLTFSLRNIASISFPLPTFSVSGDYSFTTACPSTVLPNSSCIVTVTFAPVALGLRTGQLTVNAPGNPLAVALTGTGLPSFTTSATALTFGNVDIGGGSASQDITLTSVAPIALPRPGITATGDYSTSTNCPSTILANGSCTITVIFKPTVTGTRTGTLTVDYGAATLPTTLTGNGIDFTIAVNPTSGSVIAGFGVSTVVTAAPIAGYSGLITLSCTTTAPGSTCLPSLSQFTLSAETDIPVNITTTSQYTVIGYTGGLGGGWLCLIAVGGGLLIWWKRRSARFAQIGVLMLLLAAGLTLSGCTGKLPAQNNPYTAPGNATYTLTATDGILTHSATYTLSVRVK